MAYPRSQICHVLAQPEGREAFVYLFWGLLLLILLAPVCGWWLIWRDAGRTWSSFFLGALGAGFVILGLATAGWPGFVLGGAACWCLWKAAVVQHRSRKSITAEPLAPRALPRVPGMASTRPAANASDRTFAVDASAFYAPAVPRVVVPTARRVGVPGTLRTWRVDVRGGTGRQR